MAVLLSSLHVIESLLFIKSPLESLIMLFRLLISSTISSPLLSLLKQSEIHSSRPIFALLLSRNALCLKKTHQEDCLKFAKYHENWTVEDWKRVLWSDETKTNRIGSDGRVYMNCGTGWQKSRTKSLQKHARTL